MTVLNNHEAKDDDITKTPIQASTVENRFIPLNFHLLLAIADNPGNKTSTTTTAITPKMV